MRKKKIRFIINPVSGHGHHNGSRKIPRLINKNLNSNFEITGINFTTGPGHGCQLAREAVTNKEDIVVAVGGDGCVHEVGKILIGTETSLGIIPNGSGNGIARHLGIPRNKIKAIRLLNGGQTISMDTGRVNEEPFIGIFGLGFDAMVGKAFEKSKKRGFLTYIKLTISSFFKFRGCRFKFQVEEQTPVNANAFLICVANTRQYGNNAIIAPEATVSDGFLNLTLVRKFPILAASGLAVRLFTGKINQSSHTDTWKGRSFWIEHEETVGHVDGEEIDVSSHLNIKIWPASLKMLVPENGRF